MSSKLVRAAAWLINGAILISLAGSATAGELRGRAVDLYRDQYGMAHLYAEREEDGFFGLGYAIGEDRLLQVLAWYVAVRGELGQTFGRSTPWPYPRALEDTPASATSGYFLADAVKSDRNVRKYQILESARRNMQHLPAQFQKDLRSYVQGLRAYMADNPDRTPTWAPPLEPALPLAMFHLMVLEPDGVCADRRRAEAADSHPRSAVAAAVTPAGFGASNAWAVGRTRTADGGVFLESDSHSPIETYGTLFYPYRIKAGELDFMAFDPAGSVMFFFGHSQHFAWGVTEAPRFVADCYRIKTEPNAPDRYRFGGKRQKIRSVPYRIRIRGEADERGVFEYTRHNDVLSPVEAREGEVAYAVSYASIDRVGMAAGQYYRMAKARTFTELEAALAQRDAYPANLVIAGADGTIMYTRPGRVPVRPTGIDVRRTLDGNTSTTAWKGIHTYEQALKLVNPPQGYVGNCNVSPDVMYVHSPMKAESFPPYYAFQPGESNARQERLIELLEGNPQLTLEQAKAVAMDETIPATHAWGPAIAALADSPLARAQPPDVQSFLAELVQFDGTFSKESKGALAHFELRSVLAGRDAAEVEALTSAISAGSKLTDEQQAMLINAADEAQASLIRRFGSATLTWGDVHRVGRGGVDLPIGGARLIVGPPRDGTPRLDATLRALNFRTEGNSQQLRLFGGQRVPFLVHFSAAGVQSYAQTLFGVSDDPTSPHFSDQARLASDKVLRAIPLSIAALRAERATSTTLRIPPGRQ